MKKFLSVFCLRGLCASVGGPIVLAIIFGILDATGAVETVTTGEVCTGILTVSLMAFIAAGITVVYTIDRLPLFTAILIHGAALYLDYILIYLLNGWLPSGLIPILVFSGIFVAGYAIIWLIIYFCTKRSAAAVSHKLHGNAENG